jgi:hypothetical protein
MFGTLGALIVFNRRMQKAQYSAIEGSQARPPRS